MSSRISLWSRAVEQQPKKPQEEPRAAIAARPPRPTVSRTSSRSLRTAPSVKTVEDVTVHTLHPSVAVLPPAPRSDEVEAGAWERRARQELPVPDTGDRRLRGQRKKLVPRDKTRRNTLTFTVSDEESAILRAHAATLDITFSEWVRKTLFRAAGRKIPARTRGGSAVDGD